MDQQEYQSSLEFRICREFSGMAEGKLSRFWCDGVMFGVFLLNDERPRILGDAWIGEGDEQEEWRVELLLPRQYRSPAEIDWNELLPPDNVTRWLAVDRAKKFIQIEPAAAVPDLK